MADLALQFARAKSNVEASEEDRSNASSAHQEVRYYLETDKALASCGIDTVLIGSYKRHVSISGIKDVDVLSKLPKLSHDVEPKQLLGYFVKVLREVYGDERVQAQSRSVKVEFPDFGLAVDVVPARPSQTSSYIEIPDRSGGWQQTNPEGLTELATAMNNTYGGEYVPLVKLIRQTRRTHLGKRPGGFCFEILTYHAAQGGLDRHCVSALFTSTLASIAEQHGVTAAELRSLNPLLLKILGDIADDTPLSGERRLLLPDGATYNAQAGDTLASIADAHDIPELALAQDNNLEVGAALTDRKEPLTLRGGTRYIIQFGDTVSSIASAHNIDEGDLRRLNELGDEEVSGEVWINLPTIIGYVVSGADLAEVASGFGNVTAASLAAANGVDENTVLPIGKTLHFPEDSWGAAPSDELNPGTACVEHVVSTSAFNTISGADPIVIDEPNAVSTDVRILANDNDWTVVADGETGVPNRTGVKITAGTTVTFENVVGLHNIEIDGVQQGEDFEGVGVTREFTFDTPGEYRITCSYHPDMLTVVFVTE